MALAMVEGKRYDTPNSMGYKSKPVAYHIAHALGHISEYMQGNTDEDHLGHACMRLALAIDVEEHYEDKD